MLCHIPRLVKSQFESCTVPLFFPWSPPSKRTSTHPNIPLRPRTCISTEILPHWCPRYSTTGVLHHRDIVTSLPFLLPCAFNTQRDLFTPIPHTTPHPNGEPFFPTPVWPVQGTQRHHATSSLQPGQIKKKEASDIPRHKRGVPDTLHDHDLSSINKNIQHRDALRLALGSILTPVSLHLT
jgi:hypothetical protein